MTKNRIPTRILPEQFPKSLAVLKQRPQELFLLGQFPPGTYIAMVGTRRPESGAEELCRQLVKSLIGTEAVIVSGLAQGIDSYAHRAALEFNIPTIAVLAQGLESKISGERGALAHQILEANGALVSEYVGNTPAYKGSFPARNRIIAGLSEHVVIVSSKKEGGSLITANFALQFKKKLLAVPGDFDRETAQGTNSLLRAGKAIPIYFPEDLAERCGLLKATFQTADKILTNLSAQTLCFYQKVAGFGKTISELHQSTNCTTQELFAILTELELAGIARTDDGFRYQFEKI